MNTARMEGKLRDTVACNYDNFSGKTFACRLFSTWPSFASSKKELPDIMNYVHFFIRLENFESNDFEFIYFLSSIIRCDILLSLLF